MVKVFARRDPPPPILEALPTFGVHAPFWRSPVCSYTYLKYFTGVGDASAIPSDRVFDNSHCAIVTRVNEHRFASDLGHLSPIYKNLSASEKSG